jgi:hypothetical protein
VQVTEYGNRTDRGRQLRLGETVAKRLGNMLVPTVASIELKLVFRHRWTADEARGGHDREVEGHEEDDGSRHSATLTMMVGRHVQSLSLIRTLRTSDRFAS